MKLFLLFIFICGARAKGVAKDVGTALSCEIEECQNGGVCTSDGRGGHWCTCPHGFWGVYCEKEDTYASKKEDCHCKNGHCVEENGKLKCVCNPEFGFYNEYECKACNCGPGANCTIDKGIFIDDVLCICPDGYEVKGKKCIETNINERTTESYFDKSDHTTSEDPLTTIIARTTESYFDKSDLTTLKDPLTTIIARTTESYFDKSYLTTLEDPHTISEQHLFSTDGIFSKFPYTTPDYQTTLDCGCQNGLCVIDIYGNLNCVCNPQYAKNGRGICTPCFCGQDANCQFVRSGGYIQKHCFCPEGYEDSNGYCTDINECLLPRSCPRYTECQNTEGSYDCFCREGYRPYNRSSNVKKEGCVAVCNSNTCDNGECKVDGYSYFCKCHNGFTGRRCEEKNSDNRIIDIIEIQSPWIILSALLLIIFLAFIFIHRNKSVKKNTFIFSSADDKCPLFEDPKFVNRLQTEILE